MAETNGVDAVQLVQGLERVAQNGVESTIQDHALRARMLAAISFLIPDLETPQDTSQRLLYVPCELTAAKIGVDLDLFKILCENDTPLSTEQLAQRTNANPAILRRLLKYIASISLIKEAGEDVWTASNLSRNCAIPWLSAGVVHAANNTNRAYSALPEWLQSKGYRELGTSKEDTPFSYSTGKPFFPWLQDEPENGKAFHLFMTQHRTGSRTWLDVFDIEGILGQKSDSAPLFVDVGGGFGHQCEALRVKYPQVKGSIILQDQSHVVSQAPQRPNVENMAIDFFKEQPVKGARAYYLRSILRDWSDADCQTILSHIKAQMAPDSLILIDEVVVPDQNADKFAMQLDLTMMSMLSAQARTEKNWKELLSSVGLVIDQIMFYEKADREGVIVVKQRSSCTEVYSEHPSTSTNFEMPNNTAIEQHATQTTSLFPELTSADINGLSRCVFEWADGYDKKDWQRLAANIAPTLRVDYSALGLGKWPSMSAAEFVAMASHPEFIGDPTVMCQHLIGASHYTPIATDEVEGRHQIRAAHQVYTDETLKTVKLKGHAHASNVHWYRKVDGIWKFAGIRPEILWSEFDMDKVWKAAQKRKES